MVEENKYTKQANEFLSRTNTTFKAEFVKHGKHFTDDKENRDIYEITLKRGEREFKFNFGQSIACSGRFKYLDYVSNDINLLRKMVKRCLAIGECLVNKKQESPSAYDVLSIIQKDDVDSFKDFCGDFGYDEDSRKAEKIYKAVLEEYKNVCILWNESELEQLRTIQ